MTSWLMMKVSFFGFTTIELPHLFGGSGDDGVELHGGDPGSLTAEELDGSYRDAHGTLYLTVSWRGLRDGDLTEAALPATGAPARIRSKAGARPTRA